MCVPLLARQVDLHYGELTVRETFDFAARCQATGYRLGGLGVGAAACMPGAAALMRQRVSLQPPLVPPLRGPCPGGVFFPPLQSRSKS